MKIVFNAILSNVILKREINQIQRVAVLLLFIGVCIVGLQTNKTNQVATNIKKQSALASEDLPKQIPLFGNFLFYAQNISNGEVT